MTIKDAIQSGIDKVRLDSYSEGCYLDISTEDGKIYSNGKKEIGWLVEIKDVENHEYFGQSDWLAYEETVPSI